MTSKKLLYIGLIIFFISILGGTLGVLWGISDAFSAMRTNETAGIGAVGEGIYKAMIINVIAMVGTIVGLILTIVGGIKMSQASKTNEQMP